MLTDQQLIAGYGKVQVLHGISHGVPKGKVVTLIGSNGAGKTTTMRAISGMIEPTPARSRWQRQATIDGNGFAPHRRVSGSRIRLKAGACSRR